MNIHEKSIDIDGKTLHLQFGKLARAATTSVFARMGDTCILVTVTLGKENRDIDYFPLSVEYVEKLYAGGFIKGSRWVKREGRPTEEAIL
jgi:polyribonucleotide nucleotidyltransferase